MNKFLKIAIVVVLCIIVALTATLLVWPEGGKTTTTTTTTTKPNPTHTCESVCEECGKCTNADCTDIACAEKCAGHTDPDPNPPANDFTAADKPIYVISIEVNIRNSAELKDDNKHSSAKYGDELHCTGVGEDWIRIDIDGTDYYVSADCVSDTKPIVDSDFTAKNETVYVTLDYLRVRSTPYYDEAGDNVITSFVLGDKIKRTGVAVSEDSEGIVWARVEFTLDDVTTVGYISNKYLSTSPASAADGDNGLTFERRNDTLVVVTDSIKLRDKADENAEASAYAGKGFALERIGEVTTEGSDPTTWSKVYYNGRIYYVISSNPNYIKAKDPADKSAEKFDYLYGDRFSITLPATYDITEYLPDDKTYSLVADDGAISVTEVAGITSVNVTEFANALYLQIKTALESQGADFSETDIHVRMVNNPDGGYNGYVTYFDYTQTVEDASGTHKLYFVVALPLQEGTNCYTVVLGGEGTKEEVENTLWGYVSTIELKAPTAE